MVETPRTFRGVSISPEASMGQKGGGEGLEEGEFQASVPVSRAASQGAGGGTFDETMLFFKPERNKLYLTKN